MQMFTARPLTSRNKPTAISYFAGTNVDARYRMFKFGWFVLVLLAPAILYAAPATQPTTAVTQPTAPNLQVREWAVFVVDATTGALNPQGMIGSTLPGFVTDRRFVSSSPAPAPVANPNNFVFFNGPTRVWGVVTPAGAKTDVAPLAEADLPTPAGVIRLIGSADSKVDVRISTQTGTFLGSWPKAEDRDKQLLWRDITLADQSSTPLPLVGATHWFNNLRSVRSAYLSPDKGSTDRFLLYDIESQYVSPIKAVAQGEFKYEISNRTSAALHDVTLYKGDHDTWRSINIGELPPTAGPTSRAVANPTVSATAPSVHPAQATTGPAGQVYQFAVSPTTQPSNLADGWMPTITAAGIDPIDAQLMTRIIARYAFDPRRLTAVYRMDDAEFDRLLPLEVVPQPAAIRRVALVIVLNADLAAGTMVDDLVKQLGDDDWSKREAAYQALTTMGPAAKTELNVAKGSSDLEVAWRAERLLAQLPAPAK